jgi:hypothetical protein
LCDKQSSATLEEFNIAISNRWCFSWSQHIKKKKKKSLVIRGEGINPCFGVCLSDGMLSET